MKGTLFGIGVGPGDPELLTLKAVRLMNQCDVLAWPAPESGKGLALQIAEPHLNAHDQELLPLRLPISRDPFPAQEAYDKAAEKLSSHLSSGKSVAVLCEGDPMFYGSFSYLFARLSGNFSTEVVPGVSSPMACASASGWLLAVRNEPFTVLPGPMDLESLRKRLGNEGAFALMKVGRPKTARATESIRPGMLCGACDFAESACPDAERSGSENSALFFHHSRPPPCLKLLSSASIPLPWTLPGRWLKSVEARSTASEGGRAAPGWNFQILRIICAAVF